MNSAAPAHNWTPARVLQANEYAKSKGSEGFVTVEPFWGLAKPNEEAAAAKAISFISRIMAARLQGSDLTVIPYCAQSRCFFSFMEKGEVPKHLQGFYDNPVNKDRFEAAKRVADRHGVSLSDSSGLARPVAGLVCSVRR